VRQVVEVAWESLNKNGEELCGDSVIITTTPTSFVVVLSDGLGSGVKANIMSTLTTEIAGEMFQQGATIEEVMATLVETLPECQIRKLAYATFAMLKVYRGHEAYLVEYDSPPLILVRNGTLFDLPGNEREVNGRQLREARFDLQENDYMVLVSDGYVHAGVHPRVRSRRSPAPCNRSLAGRSEPRATGVRSLPARFPAGRRACRYAPR
jgi:hypothetical protein